MTDSSPSLSVAVAGATGRMGHMLIEAILASDDCRLGGALDLASSPALGQDAAAGITAAQQVSAQAPSADGQTIDVEARNKS